jgi:hypothetical protein
VSHVLGHSSTEITGSNTDRGIDVVCLTFQPTFHAVRVCVPFLVVTFESINQFSRHSV